MELSRGLSGTIQFDEKDMGHCSFRITVTAASVNTNNAARDKHLKKEDYFDVKQFPWIDFTSLSISKDAKAGSYMMKGLLTIKGTKKEISFSLTITSQAGIYLFTGSFNINRRILMLVDPV